MYAQPDTTVTAILEGPTGLVGTLGVRIENPDGTTHTARTTAGIVEVEAGSGVYVKANLTAPDTVGTYIILWDTGGGSPVFSTEELVVTHTLPASALPTSGIIDLAEYKTLMGVQPADTRKDTQITALLPAAAKAVRTYTGRNFEIASGPATEREFQYDESGMLDIDDCTNITAIETDAGVANASYSLDSAQWTAMPQDDSDVFYYVVIHGGPYFGLSPEMGFERNLDQYPYLAYKSPLVRVTAQWGWASIPDDVKLATAFTVQEFLGSTGGASGKTEGLTSEGIEGWNRAWGARGGGVQALAIPNRARDLLVNYQRIFV